MPGKMPSVDLDAWHDLFVAGAGAAAALVGLIIVAVTVNIEKIIDSAAMTSRAAATVAGLTLILVVSCAGLIPDQSSLVLGIEIAFASVVASALTIRSADRVYRLRREGTPFWFAASQITFVVLPPAVMLVGGVLLSADLEAGLYAVAIAIVVGFAAAVANAWVLLVEILR